MVKTLLIIDSKTDYFSAFKDVKSITYTDSETGDKKEEELKVDQASWEDIYLSAYSDTGIVVDLRAARVPIYGSPQCDNRTIKPDFVLIRNMVRGLPHQDFRNLLYGFAYAGIPTLNSIESIIWNLERPLSYAGLLTIHNRLGKDKFPLIPQTYYPRYTEMNFTPEYPIVVKVGHIHAGFGKMMLQKHDDFNDLASILALHEDYCTAEQFISASYDLRIQKIGNHYRVYRRTSCVGWKSNVGTAILEDVPVTEQYKLWVDECSKLFGGMDILAVDAVHNDVTGKDYILECNDTSIGLGPEHEEEDVLIIKQLTLDKMVEAFSQIKVVKEDKKVDSTIMYKKLEAELINTDNARMDLEKKLKETQSRVVDLTEANRKWRSFTLKYVVKLIGGGIGFGIGMGIIASVLWRWRKRVL